MKSLRPLRLMCWEGYDHPSITQPFTDRTGSPLATQTLVSDADTAAAVLTGAHSWDILNINNAYVSGALHPAGLVRELPAPVFRQDPGALLPSFRELNSWCHSADGTQVIGIGQRFGTFNLVVNTKSVSRATGRSDGFNLTQDQALPFGVLCYEDFNIFHVCMAAGLNPFVQLTNDEQGIFERTAEDWFSRASIVTDDHHTLNQALVDRRIAFYLSGGVYTASPARVAGHHEVEAITPSSGPINGRGGIAFAEVTCALNVEDKHPHAEAFLEYLLEPDTAARIAFVDGTCNPVAQMADERVRSKFSAKQLHAIQWDTLDEDIAACAHYNIVPDHTELLRRLRVARSLSGK